MKKFGRICKEYMVKEIAGRFKNYPDFFVTTFSRVGVGDMEKFRKSFKKDSAVYVVVRNSMLKRAIEVSGKDKNLVAEPTPLMAGSCGVLFSKADPVAVARLLMQFSREYQNFKIQGGFINGEKVSLDTINLLACLPPKNVLLAMVASGIKAPISGFVALLCNLLRNLIWVIDAVSRKKGKPQQT